MRRHSALSGGWGVSTDQAPRGRIGPAACLAIRCSVGCALIIREPWDSLACLGIESLSDGPLIIRLIIPTALVQNLRRGHDELAVEEPVTRRLSVAFDELALAI